MEGIYLEGEREGGREGGRERERVLEGGAMFFSFVVFHRCPQQELLRKPGVNDDPHRNEVHPAKMNICG